MKSILISIKPEWCEHIANHRKVFEIRKSRPKVDNVFKCYIYCTNDKSAKNQKRQRRRKNARRLLCRNSKPLRPALKAGQP